MVYSTGEAANLFEHIGRVVRYEADTDNRFGR